MPSTRLLVLGIAVAALLGVLVLLAAVDALRSSRKRPDGSANRRDAQDPTEGSGSLAQQRERRQRPAAANRYTPHRTRLRWYSPEILAVLLLSLAAGLWLARLAG